MDEGFDHALAKPYREALLSKITHFRQRNWSWRSKRGLAGLYPRESLYRALSADGNPSFATVLKVICALGVRLNAKAA
ncbi:MAG: DNA-binding protein [Myxococcaceae bacterium]